MSMKPRKQKVKLFKKKKVIPEAQVIEELQSKYDNIDEVKIKTFADLPLSSKTKQALKENDFIEPTDIQKQSIGLSIRGNDILGAAKTGSGKTLAFLIPILEILYCKQWSRVDGVGALVITPTRELAFQIFETLRKIGRYHDISAGLIIGGKDLHFEKKRMDQCNIIIGTPGRILHHMDENPLFDCNTMQILVLDEADRCLDMGFEKDMNAIIANLPPERQTLLFSATQTKSVKDLARLSLKNPMYVSVHEHAEHTTPEGLQQSYVVCNLEDKMALLFSFIKHHHHQKIIVFLSSCKQVKYTYEIFCKLRPGNPLTALYGSLHQMKRMRVYEEFCRKQNAVLFATDIAARGLDFPAVNWVVQMDCPEDTNAYIHRAGRTARFQRGGESLLVLLPSEIEMVRRLEEKRIPIKMIQINKEKIGFQQGKVDAFLAKFTALKESAQRCFAAYIKSVFLMKDKEIFNVHALNTDAYARSLGLAIPPRIRFLQRMEKNAKKGKTDGKKPQSESAPGDREENETGENLFKCEASSGDELEEDEPKINGKEPMMREEEPIRGDTFDNDDSDDEDFLTIKRKNVHIEGELPEEDFEDLDNQTTSRNKKAVTKAALAKKILKKKIVPNKKTTFDEEGQEMFDGTRSKISELGKQYENEEESGINIEKSRLMLQSEDPHDKKRFRELVKAKHKEEKRKLKAQKAAKTEDEEDEGQEDEGEQELEIGSGSDDDDFDEPDLSWLPDPDKIYGPKKDSSNEDSEEEIQQVHRPSKRKLITQNEGKNPQKKQRLKITENSNLLATEELALQLLRN